MVRLFLSLSLCAGLALADDASVQRDGFQLHYRAEGAGQPVVFLSGGPGFEVDYMKPAAEFFPPGFQAIFLEQRGTGRSMPPKMTAENFTLSLVVEDLEALRVALKQERLFLVGHSWGGMLAMAYAAAHPDRVDRLILISSGGPTTEFFQSFGDTIQSRMYPEDKAAELRAMKPLLASGSDQAFLDVVKARTPAYFFDRAKGLDFVAHTPAGSLHYRPATLLQNDLAKHYDSRPGLARLDRPTLIIEGHQDPIGEKVAEDIHAVIRSSTLRYIHRCGHFPWIEQPDAFRKIVAGFLAAK